MGLIYCILALRFYSGFINAFVCFLCGEGGSLKKLEKRLLSLSYNTIVLFPCSLEIAESAAVLFISGSHRSKNKKKRVQRTKETLRQLGVFFKNFFCKQRKKGDVHTSGNHADPACSGNVKSTNLIREVTRGGE